MKIGWKESEAEVAGGEKRPFWHLPLPGLDGDGRGKLVLLVPTPAGKWNLFVGGILRGTFKTAEDGKAAAVERLLALADELRTAFSPTAAWDGCAETTD